MQKAKPIVMIIVLLSMTAALWAVPAKPGQKRLLTLADGTQVQAMLVGDEHGHYWMGDDGRAYQNGGGDAQLFRAVDAAEVKQRAAARRAAVNRQRMNRLPRRALGTMGSYTGQKKALILLVNFSDIRFDSKHTQARYNDIANTQGYNGYSDFNGSMHDYFYDQSRGLFDLTFDVVGPITVSQKRDYYGANDSNDQDKHPAEMIIEAVKMADTDFGVDFAQYDWDGDGYVDQVYVVYAGNGENDTSGTMPSTIWPHAYDLSSASYYGDGTGPVTVDGVKVNTYACGSELQRVNSYTSKIAGIGVMCHEFSHCLGFPDFYDTDYSGGQGTGDWDIMCSGSYNNNSFTPAGYTSYERWAAGWMEPVELEYTQTVKNMKSLQEDGESYVIYNKGNSNEYFLLENRQKVKWDKYLPGAGLLILHVDYSASAWNYNTPNDDPNHQRMTWMPANNNYSSPLGGAYPYNGNNTFSKSSTPAAQFYNRNTDGTYYMDSSVENITQNSDRTVSFRFKGLSNVAAPTFSPAPGRYDEPQTVTIGCDTEGATIYYTLDGTTPTAASTAYDGPLTIGQTTTVKAVAVSDGDMSGVATAKYVIGASVSDPTTKYFKRVTAVSEMESGLRYVIACGSKQMAAGALNSSYLGNVAIDQKDDILTVKDGVAVFVVEESTSASGGWTFKNESTGEYLYATAARSVKYTTTASPWTLNDGTDGVTMAYGSYGTMLYNTSSPRFTTYTSTPTTSLIQANLYVEYSGTVETGPDPLIVADDALDFSTTVGTPQTKTFEVLSEGLTDDISLALTDPSGVFQLSTTTVQRAASESGAEVSITFNPSAAGTYTATLALSSSGAETVTVALTGTATGGNTTPQLQGTGRYQLVTATSELESGKNYLIVSGTKAYNGLSTDKGLAAPITKEGNIIDLNNSANQNKAVPVVLTEESATAYASYWSVYDTSKEVYLTAASSNKLGSASSYSLGKTTWTIKVSSNVATVKNYNNDACLKYNSGADMFRAYSSGQTAIALYKEIEEPVVETVSVRIGATGHATLYYGEQNLTVPQGVDAYTYTISNGALEPSWLYEAGDVIPQGTAVVLIDQVALGDGEDHHDYEFAVTASEGDVDEDNVLLGFDEAAGTVGPDGGTEGYKFYMLSLNAQSEPGSVGFYYGKAGGAAFVSKAHRAYLAVSKDVSLHVRAFLLDGRVVADETTAIALPDTFFVSPSGGSETVYNLQGQRVFPASSVLPKGVYIVGGRKVVVR